ncbi:hypothetical protein [Halobacteriovorax sp.]|uniref:hypothetical protein n=1 Tax=Halobacteriovorax sp. TaxID=2020862 RepID=UPI0035636F9B
MANGSDAKNIQYLEVDQQRLHSPGNLANGSGDLDGSYLSKNISIFGKIFIGFMICIFIVSFVFLVFSYTPYGVDFLREMKIHII